MNPTHPTIAYIIKEYPRNSEAFITNEIALLEAKGLSIHIFSVKKPSASQHSSVVMNIVAPITYLPTCPSLTTTPLFQWLRQSLPRFVQSHRSLLSKRPLAYIKTLGEVLVMCFRYRAHVLAKPKVLFFKEFLQAGYIADQVINRGRTHHLHAHFCHGSTTIALLASRLTGTPYSFTAHAKDIYLPSLNPKDLLQKKIQRARFVVTCTEANREHLQQLHPTEPSKIYRVYHGVNKDRFTPSLAKSQDMPLILSVGRHVKKKGFPFLIRACGILRDRGHRFHCVILGEPDEETLQIRESIQALKLEEIIRLEPAVNQDALRTIYHRATIFTLACHIVASGDRDGIPNVLAEAMAAEIPVVATSISGIPEIITHKHNGLLVPQKNPEAMADALEELLMNPSLRTALAKVGRETILHSFDSQTTIEDLAQLFQCANPQTVETTPLTSTDDTSPTHTTVPHYAHKIKKQSSQHSRRDTLIIRS